MCLVDLNYNFECDWLIEPSDNNLASELLENVSFKPITIEEIVIFITNMDTYCGTEVALRLPSSMSSTVHKKTENQERKYTLSE